MKEIVLLRHAKSSWEYDVEDRNRPLLQKGIDRITKTSRQHKNIFENHDYIFSSPANRAFHTASIMIFECGFNFSKFSIDETFILFNVNFHIIIRSFIIYTK